MSDVRRVGSGGLILCGGRSSRMGYEKARLRFPGGTLLERMLERLSAVADPIVLSLAPGQATPRRLPEQVLTVKDGVANQGPLWGLAEGFRRLKGRCERVLVMPVDMPFYTGQWMARLLDEMEGRRACLYEHEGFANALTAAYSMELLPKLEALLAAGRRRPIFLIEGEDARVLTLPAQAHPGGHPLADVDTPEAYRDALLLEGIGRAGAAEITVEIRTPESVANVFPAGYVALYADRADEALRWTQQLYPELRLDACDGSVRLLRTADAKSDAEATALAPGAALWRGEHLRLETGAPGTPVTPRPEPLAR